MAIAKLVTSLPYGSCITDWQKLLLQTDGSDKSKDEFVEALIYDSFDIGAVDSMEATRKNLSKEASLDARIAKERFAARAPRQMQTK